MLKCHYEAFSGEFDDFVDETLQRSFLAFLQAVYDQKGAFIYHNLVLEGVDRIREKGGALLMMMLVYMLNRLVEYIGGFDELP